MKTFPARVSATQGVYIIYTTLNYTNVRKCIQMSTIKSNETESTLHNIYYI